MKKSILAASLLAITLAAPLAQAHKAGDIIIRAGAITVDPHEKSGHVYVDRGAVASTGLAAMGGKATLDSDTQLGLNFAYMITDHIGVELLAATPFTHNVHVKNTSLGPYGGVANGKLGQVTQLPPTLSLVYYPLDSSWAFQPYVGVGINYTWFYHTSLSTSAKYSGAQYSNFKVRDTWGWAAQVGADYMITDSLMLNAQIRYINIDTQATVNVNAFNTTAGLGQQRARVNLDVNPWVYMVGIGYKFNL